MKKGWKRFWMICGSVFLAGVFLCLVSLGMGFSREKLKAVYPYGIGITDSYSLMYDWDDDWDDDAVRNQEAVSGTFTKDYPHARELDLEMAGGELYIQYYDGDTIRVEAENLNPELQFRSYVDGETFCIRTSKKVWKENGLKDEEAGRVTVMLPQGSMEEISLKVGAGILQADELYGSTIEIETGVGEAVVRGIEAYELEMQCGTGTIEAECAAMGDISIDCGIGSVQLMIGGAETDYQEEISCGIGHTRVGSREYHGLGKEVNGNHHGQWELEVECGIGDVTIDFKE
ncbi:MAG TPA: hypothetical protein DCZ20_09705 [Lachnospiraceae bacterium]|nr:hypothetical protein [Lachnospiraceae bacterium]